MGIILGGGDAAEPYWLGLDGFSDLKLKVRPLLSETVALVNLKADRQVEEFLAQRQALMEYGADLSGLPDLSDDDQISAFRTVLFMVALGQAVIVDWQGVFAESGGIAPVNDSTIAKLMRTYPVGTRFRAAYLAQHLVRSAEKNACAPSPNGTTASAPAGAAGAGTGAENAADQNPVRTSATSRKPPPG